LAPLLKASFQLRLLSSMAMYNAACAAAEVVIGVSFLGYWW
jgi:hypothetical protein